MDATTLIQQVATAVWEVISSLSLTITVAILFLFWRRKEMGLTKIPAVPGLPVIGNLLQVLNLSEDLLEDFSYWARKYGPIFTFEVMGIKRVILTGPKEIGAVLRSDRHIDKDRTLVFLHPWLGTGLLTSTGDKWRSRRRMLTPAFHYKVLEDFVPVFNANSAILVDKLRTHLQDDYVEIEDYIALCTLNIICETALGTSLAAHEGGGQAYVESVRSLFEVFSKRVARPWLYSDIVYRMTSLYRREQRLLSVVHGFSNKAIKERKSKRQSRKSPDQLAATPETPERPNFLDILLDMSEEGELLTDEDIREEVDTIIVAGHDTTAAATSWSLFLLGSHPDIQERLIAEQQKIFAADRRQPTAADLHNMVYLEMVVKEVLRLYPSSVASTREIQTEIDIGGYTVSPGTVVILSLYCVQRDPDIYPDPDKFDPERFSPEQMSGRHPYAYIPFSGGPRNCIGQKFARLEIKSVLSSIFRNFRIELLNNKENVKPIPGVVIRPSQKIKIKISELRKKDT